MFILWIWFYLVMEFYDKDTVPKSSVDFQESGLLS